MVVTIVRSISMYPFFTIMSESNGLRPFFRNRSCQHIPILTRVIKGDPICPIESKESLEKSNFLRVALFFHRIKAPFLSRHMICSLSRISHKPGAIATRQPDARRPGPCLAASDRAICPKRINQYTSGRAPRRSRGLPLLLARQALTTARYEVVRNPGSFSARSEKSRKTVMSCCRLWVRV
jgi:hypothetical protein